MYKKRTFISLMILVMISGTLLAAGQGESTGSGEDTGPVTMSVFVNHTWFPGKSFTGIIPEEITKRTGVILDPTVALDGKQLGLLIASGDLPELVYTANYLDRLSDPAICYDWGSLIQKYAPSFVVDDLRQRIAKSYSKDGKFYTVKNAFSTAEEWAAAPDGVVPTTPSVLVREDLYKQIGSPVLKSVDDFIAMLAAAKKKFPDLVTTYSFSEYWNWQPLFNWAGLSSPGWASGAGGGFVEMDNGEVLYYANQPGYKDILKKINYMWREGLIITDNFTLKSTQPITDWVNSGKVFAQSFCTSGNAEKSTAMIQDSVPGASWFEVIPFTKETRYFASGTGWSGTFVTKNNKHPDKAIKLLEFLFSTEGQRLSQWGREGIEYVLGDDGRPQFSEEWLTTRAAGPEMVKKYNPWFYFGISQVTEGVGRGQGLTPNSVAAMTEMRKHIKFNPDLTLAMPLSDTDEGIVNQKINEYMRVKEQMVILSEDDKTFDAQYAEMISDIKKMGVEDLEAYLVQRLAEIR